MQLYKECKKSLLAQRNVILIKRPCLLLAEGCCDSFCVESNRDSMREVI